MNVRAARAAPADTRAPRRCGTWKRARAATAPQGAGGSYSEAVRFTALDHLLGDEDRFHGSADTDVVGDQQPHRVLLQRHQQGTQPQGPRLDTGPSPRARNGPAASRDCRTGVAQQAARTVVAEAVRRRRRKLRLGDGSSFVRMPVDSMSLPVNGLSCRKSSVDSGWTTDSRPRAGTREPGGNCMAGFEAGRWKARDVLENTLTDAGQEPNSSG